MRLLTPHLLRPLRGGAPSLIVIFAIGLTIAEMAGLFGLAMGLILLSWYSKYAFILFDSIICGVGEPPALDIQMVNPVDEQRPLALLCILGGMYWICHALSGWLGGAAGLSMAAIFMFCLPASVAVLGTERNAFKALNPVAWFRFVAGLGWLYLLLLTVIAFYLFLIIGISRLGLWSWVHAAVVLFSGLSIFSFLGGFMYERRDALGMEVSHSPEKHIARQQALEMKMAAKTIDEAYGLIRSGQHVAAWAGISAWLASRHHGLNDYAWLLDRVVSWGDDRYRIRVAQEYLDRLLALGLNGHALDLAQQALRRDASFRPKSAQSTLRVAQLAAVDGAPGVARALLADYATRFEGDPGVRAAEQLAERLAH